MLKPEDKQHCPVCAKRGIKSALLTLTSTVGHLTSLCSSPRCTYPFGNYQALASSTVSEPGDSSAQQFDDFLNEILGSSTALESSPYPSELAQPVRNHSSIDGSESVGVVGHVRSDLSAPDNPASIDFYGLCTKTSTGSGYLLPRYLADDLKRVTVGLDTNPFVRSKKPRSSLASRKPGGSCDSGVSILSGPSQISATYEEDVSPRLARAPVASAALSNNHPRPSSADTDPLSPPFVSRVDHLIERCKQRLCSGVK
ncbi:unnamed protein product [Calicophoron daubneyi]|uniref:Uncharacterized protein n=1 Tax=Calicophoron daubneyi TaxID=300641 RepID=A0AAV2TZK5_CALDB